MKKRTYLYIDGTNLFAGLVEIFGAKRVPDFKTILDQVNLLYKLQSIYFYCSYMLPRNNSRSERELLSAEVGFYETVKAVPGLVFYRGHRSKTSKKEKGVDVHLASDIVLHACRRQSDEMVIMTGDSDLIYPMEIAKNLSIYTAAIFIPTRFSLELSYKVRSATVLNYLGLFNPNDRKVPRQLKIMDIKKPRV